MATPCALAACAIGWWVSIRRKRAIWRAATPNAPCPNRRRSRSARSSPAAPRWPAWPSPAIPAPRAPKPATTAGVRSAHRQRPRRRHHPDQGGLAHAYVCRTSGCARRAGLVLRSPCHPLQRSFYRANTEW